MEISQLRTVLHVSELGSLSKASERLNIAQPALSRQVRLLEDELGVRLFDRHGRGMVPTTAGLEVVKHAQRVLSELQEMRATVADENAALRGHVSIGMPPTVADILTVPLVSAFQKRHPEATLRIVSAYSAYLLDWLLRGDVDVALLFEANISSSLRAKALLEETLHLVGPPNSGLKESKAVSFAELAHQNMLLPSVGHGLRKIVEDSALEAKIDLKVQVEADSYTTLKNLVKTGHGMTVLPLAPIHEEIMAQELCFAPLTAPTPIRRIMMCEPADRPILRLAQFASHTLKTTVDDLVKHGIWAGRLLEQT